MKRSISGVIDDFCRKHPNFGLRNLMLYIIGGCAAVYFLASFDSSNSLIYLFAFNFEMILKGQIWRLITFIFLPTTSGAISVAITLYFYYLIGIMLEREWGKGKFTLYYLTGILLTDIVAFICCAVFKISYLPITSFYINTALLFAYSIIYPENIVLLFFIIPVKMKYIGLFNLVYFIYNVAIGTFPLNLFPVVAILNCLIFCYDDIVYFIKGNISRRNVKYNEASSNFRHETHEAEREDSSKTYRHKCAVCGRTDTDYPNLQFRYCSRCQGYHCFCEDHINNHIHFTE